jgi:hypothetical protein
MPHKPLSSKIDHSHVEDHNHSHETNHDDAGECDVGFEEYIDIL